MLEIEFRPSFPEDVAEAVPLIFASGPSTFNCVFTTKTMTAIDFLKHTFPRQGGEFSFDNHYTLLLNQKIIGIGSVFSGKRGNSFMFKDILNIIRCYKVQCHTYYDKGINGGANFKNP